jgi:predicted DNA-binding protein
MRNSAVATSIKLPEGVNGLIDTIIKNQHVSRAKFMRDAILEKIEDCLDIQLVEEILAKNEKRYSFDEIKHEFDLEN